MSRIIVLVGKNPCEVLQQEIIFNFQVNFLHLNVPKCLKHVYFPKRLIMPSTILGSD